MNPLIECLGWTLVHFVWQGVVIALLLAVALRLLRRAPANQRYLAGCVALALMVLAPLLTSYYLAKRAHAAPTVSVEQASVAATPTVEPPQPESQVTKVVVAAKPIPAREELTRRLNNALPWLVTGWFLGVLALSCRLLAGWLRIRRWRNGATEAIADHWRERLSELARRLSISRPVRLVQSALVEVPTVIGWLRPVILLPASCLTGLSPQQLESILAHELAHIHRHDYLINLLQSAAETLLFYHPAVWWVSRRIREERENCCDDVAVRTCGDPVTYARALATLEELRSAPAQLALAAGGGSLLQRIQRLLGKSGSTTGPAAWPLAGAIVVVALMTVAIGLRESRASASESPAAETFITTFGVYHYTNSSIVRELTIQTNGVYLSASKWMFRSSAGEGTWNPVRGWFVYIGTNWHVWVYDGARGLDVIEADSRSSRTMPLGNLDEIPPDAVLKRLPKDLKKTALGIATPNSEKREEFEEMIRDAETHTNLHPHQMSKKRAVILSKLNHIRLESVEFDNLPLAEVISWLNKQARLHDPDRKGIDFFIDRETPVSIAAPAIADPTTGLPTTAERASDIDSVKVKIMPVLKDVRLGDVLDAITKTSDRPIKFLVYDTAVGFSLQGPEIIPLETRTFHVSVDELRKGLEKAGFYAPVGETNGDSRSEDVKRLHVALRKFFTSRGGRYCD